MVLKTTAAILKIVSVETGLESGTLRQLYKERGLFIQLKAVLIYK